MSPHLEASRVLSPHDGGSAGWADSVYVVIRMCRGYSIRLGWRAHAFNN